MVKINKRKQGFIASALVDFYAYLAFVLVIIVFFALFNLKVFTQDPAEQEISSYTDSRVKANEILLAYLRSPVELDLDNDRVNERLTFGELISVAVHDNDVRDKLKLETENYLELLQDTMKYPAVTGWNIKITQMPAENELLKVTTYNVVGKKPVAEADIKLPVMNSDNFVIVTAYKESQVES